MSNKLKSYTLVSIQLGCIALIAFTGPIFPKNIFFLSTGITGSLLGLWAIIVMGLGRFNITPEVHPNSRMKSKGPYKYIRHPMYMSVLLITLTWILNYPTTFRLTIWMVLIFDLIIKLKYEEKLLVNRYKEYQDYQHRTKKLIPFIY
jgi:protein-S-isoprenylcysteine O-methyltransferase Ste14